MKYALGIFLLFVIIFVAIIAVIIALNNLQLTSSEYYTVSEVTTILRSYDISVVNIKDFTFFKGFSHSPIYVKFDMPKDFAVFCRSKNITTTMHYYGNMVGGICNYDYFFFIEDLTVYRYVLE